MVRPKGFEQSLGRRTKALFRLGRCWLYFTVWSFASNSMQQADGSPAGSGQAQQIDGNVIAMQMIQATTNAAEAAQAAVKAVEALKSGSDDKNWYRLLPKPGDFNPSSREDEISKWRDWSWQFEQYLGSLDHHYVSDIVDLRKNPTHVVDETEQSSEEQRRSIFMYGLMAALLKGRPLLMLKAVKNFNGYEGYRQLVLSNEPKSQNRSMSLLNVIMTWPQFSPKTSMISQVMKLESAFQEYEKLGDVLPETIRSAVLLRCLTGQLKTWMQLQLGESTKYADIREGVLSYERSTTRWSESMVLGEVPDASAPMEVDRLQWNPKGKDKGKGKFKGPKGKGVKGKDFKGSDNKGKKGGGKYGSKGKYNSNSKGKNLLGSAGKGKSSGPNASITCFNCGRTGHKADQCWQPKKVRNVEQTIDGASSGAAPSQQCAGSSANGSMYAGSSSAAYVPDIQQSSASTSQSVRRVAMDDGLNVYLFDICPSVTTPEACVRMISGCELGHVCEEFFIGDSDSDVSTVGSYNASHIYSSEVDWSLWKGSSQPESCPLIFALYEKYKVATFCSRSFVDITLMPVSNRSRRQGPQVVRAVSHDPFSTSIVIDSGSDATVVPTAFADCGLPIQEIGSIQDCQGRKIPTAGMREFHFVMQDVCGRTIVLKDYGFLSEQVSGPLISYGHLFRNGWDIGRRDDGSPMLKHADTGICLAMDFKNDSFVVEAAIRQVAAVGDVRAIKVDVPELWSQAETGWNETVRGFPIARTNGNFYVDPADRFSFEDYPYRTTLSFNNGQYWEQVERCKPLASMDNRCMPLNSMGAITILTWSVLSADEIGYIICTDQSQRSSQFLYPAPASSSGQQLAAGFPRPGAGEQVGRPESQNELVQPEVVAVPNPALESQAAPVTPDDRLAPTRTTSVATK